MPHRILVIDDDPTVLKMLDHYLGDTLRYQVTMAPSGEEALECAMQGHYDLCIMDVRMPGLSGSETYTRLKNIHPQIEAIFFTGDSEFENDLDFLRFSLPKDRVITKPVENLSVLTRLIISILGPPTP